MNTLLHEELTYKIIKKGLLIVPCNSVKIRGKQVVKGFSRVSVVNLDVKGHNGTHTFVPRADNYSLTQDGIF